VKRRYLGSWLALAALLCSLAATGGTAAAQGGGTVIADGLNHPRGVAVGPDGTVYVAESGTGGDQVIQQGDLTIRLGNTSQITAVAPGGGRRVAARGFFSALVGEEGGGLHGLIYAQGALWSVIQGGLAMPQPPPGTGVLVRIDPGTGASTTVADLQAFEKQNNPDGFLVDSNPYGLTLGPDGMIYVADAGGNTIVRANPVDGAVSLLAVLPGLPLPPGMAPPGGNPDRGGANELDPVPTGVAFGPDGALYASLLSGGPFPPGAAKVVRVTMDGRVSDAVPGLTMLTDIKLGPDGAWYVVQFAEFDFQSTPPGFKPGSGRVWRLRADGQHEVVAGGLMFPNMITFDQSGNLYVTTNSVIPGAGQVVRYNAMGGVLPGMPRTGTPLSPAALAALGLVLLAGGLVLRRAARRFRPAC
jgi:sugar lactone lactonase YvrE